MLAVIFKLHAFRPDSDLVTDGIQPEPCRRLIVGLAKLRASPCAAMFCGVLALLMLFGAAAQAASASDANAAALLASGIKQYEASRYEHAATLLEDAIALEPGSASAHHWLGKAYGRLAEQASWFDAIGLASKTRDALERAVELDPDNVDALEDLLEYHQSAPAFLGGSDERAAEIERRLSNLRTNHNPAPEPGKSPGPDAGQTHTR